MIVTRNVGGLLSLVAAMGGTVPGPGDPGYDRDSDDRRPLAKQLRRLVRGNPLTWGCDWARAFATGYEATEMLDVDRYASPRLAFTSPSFWPRSGHLRLAFVSQPSQRPPLPRLSSVHTPTADGAATAGSPDRCSQRYSVDRLTPRLRAAAARLPPCSSMASRMNPSAARG